MSQVVVIQDLILGAADGAAAGVQVLQNADIAVELEEFELEVTYAAETEVTNVTEGKAELKFKVFKASIGHTRTSRSKATYGLKVRFLFSGKEKQS
jgi:hypothetical protein